MQLVSHDPEVQRKLDKFYGNEATPMAPNWPRVVSLSVALACLSAVICCWLLKPSPYEYHQIAHDNIQYLVQTERSTGHSRIVFNSVSPYRDPLDPKPNP
jgi:hypothetical protein